MRLRQRRFSLLAQTDSIDCDNNVLRDSNGYAPNSAIELSTTGDDFSIDLYNGPAGTLIGENYGINTLTDGDNAEIVIETLGDITVSGGAGHLYGIRAETGVDGPPQYGDGSFIVINNSGDITVVSTGLYGEADDPDSEVYVFNSASIFVDSGDIGHGINIEANDGASPLTIRNLGDITVYADGRGTGLRANGLDADGNLICSSRTVVTFTFIRLVGLSVSMPNRAGKIGLCAS